MFGKNKKNTADRSSRSIYDRAAADGALFGVYFSVLFLVSVASLKVGMLNILVLTMVLLVPFITYRFLRRTHVDAHGLESFSGLWMQGIITFGCGSLILCLVAYLFMRFVYPDFVVDTLRAGIEFYSHESTPAGEELAAEFQSILDKKLYPAPSTIAIMWLWLGTFTGSILSMFEAAIVKFTKTPPAGK